MFEDYAKAIDAVQKACELCQTVQQSLLTEDTIAKKDKSPVTVADYGAQAVINHLLQEAFPNDSIIGEEESSFLRDADNAGVKENVVSHAQKILPELSEADILASIDRGGSQGGPEGRFWALDPIDGTKGFLRGEQYAVALALIENGEVVFGVLGCPNLPKHLSNPRGICGCLFMAGKGRGAFMKTFSGDARVAMRTSKTDDPSRAVFCESVESGHSKQNDAAMIAEHLGVRAEPVRMDSQCKYAVVARGDAEIYLRMPTRADYQEKVWDHAAGWVIVKEAGGEVTDITGAPLDFSAGRTLKNNRGIVASNGPLHKQIVEAINRIDD